MRINFDIDLDTEAGRYLACVRIRKVLDREELKRIGIKLYGREKV